MKRIEKKDNSEVIIKNLKSPKDNFKIREILEKEQSNFCAYTEYRLTAGFARDLEHFNPKIKNTNKDNYYNWFVVSHKWNNKKYTKWSNFQPILNPTAKNFDLCNQKNDSKKCNYTDYNGFC